MKLDCYDSEDNNQTHKTPLIFVHGAWCGKWIWQENYIPFFENRGYRCLAMDLRGHGNSEGKENLKGFTIDDYVEDVLSILKRVDGNGILIGHSLGGGIIEKIISKTSVKGAVLLAPVPPQGGKKMYDRFMKEYRGKMFKILFTKNLYTLVEDPDENRRDFFSKKISDEAFFSCQKKLGNESYRVSIEIKKPLVTGDPNPYHVPILLIGAEQDWFFPPEEIRKAGKIYNIEPKFYDNGHGLLLENDWEIAANDIDQWIKGLGL